MIFSIIAFILLLLFPTAAHAIYDPRTVPNNPYGIHIIDTDDLGDARILVNSSGGDWGYVTLVIAESDRNIGKWQNAMNEMRRLHLIPIIRIATHVDNASWVVPQEIDADKWADFLNKLNWPTENRYVVLFNEPNHAKEWGNSLNPEEFARISVTYAKKLKEKSEDFFILPAGLDGSAPNGRETMDSSEYLRRMKSAVPEFFDVIDGWTSHAYPNPAFSGPATAFGKGTIRGFIWERTFLHSLGVTKPYPIFITETGWQHSGGKLFNPSLPTPEDVANRITMSSQSVWNDPDIVAITPFLLNYQDIPFDHFSFRKYLTKEYYPHFFAYQKIQKTDGKPKQHESFTFLIPFLPSSLIVNSSYTLTGTLINNGQSIIDPTEGDELIISDPTRTFTTLCTLSSSLEPTEQAEVSCAVRTPITEGTFDVAISKVNQGIIIPIQKRLIELVPPPTVEGSVRLGWKTISTADDVTVLVFDLQNELIHKFTNLRIEKGKIQVSGLYHIVPDASYRVVILVPYYLPRQIVTKLGKTRTTIHFDRLLPFDFDNDGALTVKDLSAWLFTKPHDTIARFF